MLAVEVVELSRTYPGRRGKSEIAALDRVSISLEQGEILGLLGPNGAGKTTLAKILSTALLPSSGSAHVMGLDVVRDVREVRKLIGVVFGGDRGLYARLTARENIYLWGTLYGVRADRLKIRVQELLERVGLVDRSDSRVETFSRGMKQRLHLARALVASPKVLFLDEPTMGMDPIAARAFRVLVKELQKEGTSILLTTHDMAEAETVCDRVALVDHGRLLAVETPEALSKLVSMGGRIEFEATPESIKAFQSSSSYVISAGLAPGTFSIESQSDERDGIIRALMASGIVDIRSYRPTLEDVYVKVIGDRGLRI